MPESAKPHPVHSAKGDGHAERNSTMNLKTSISKKNKKDNKTTPLKEHVHDIHIPHNERGSWYTMKNTTLPLPIRILARASLVWEVAFYFTIIINYVLTTYGCFFTYFNENVWKMVSTTDMLFFFDVSMRLSIEIWRHRRQSEVLVFTLPYRVFHGLLDTLTLFPFYVIAARIFDTDRFDHLSWLDWFRTVKFLRLYRAFKFFEILKVRRLISEEGHFLLIFGHIYLIFINTVSCIFFLFTHLLPVDFLLWSNFDKLEVSWANEFRKKKPGYGKDPFDLYILSTHFSTATVTTVGYGDVHGENAEEMIACIIIMLIGAILMNGYYTSQITNFQLELDSARYELFFRLEGILQYVKEIGMSDFFQEKIQLYYKCLWTYREGVDRVVFIEHIPRAVQDDMFYDICLEMFHKSYLFRNLDEAFLRAVSKIAKISIYNPDMILCRYGGYANKMYYILQGECQAMSKHDRSKPAAILRAGSLIGETNLFFSCPYTIAVQTSTCCQFIYIEKEELMQCFYNFPAELAFMRSRTQTKIRQMYEKFTLYGEDPICWVQRNIDKEEAVKIGTADCISKDIRARWGQGLNFLVNEDVLDDAKNFVIFETLCRDTKNKKNHLTPYMTCVVPEILNPRQQWMMYWNAIIMIFALVYSFLGPYCFSFGASSQFQQYLCLATTIFQYFNEIIYMGDVLVEIIGACPVQGIYFKLKDGLQVKVWQPLFYLDILAAIPIELWGSPERHDLLHAVNVMIKSMKLWKVIRYLRFLDNVHPKKLFWLRLGQTFLVLMYGTHFIACIMFFLACPTEDDQNSEPNIITKGDEDKFKCSAQGWLASYKSLAIFNNLPVPKEYEPNSLAATNFSPQNIVEIMFTALFQLLGFFLIGYYTALLTSALTCVVKPRLEFQQKLLSVRRFMNHCVLPSSLQRRIIEHYELQFQFNYGINLPLGVRHYLFDAPDYIKHDVLYTDVVLLLDGIPLFSQTESKFIIKMAERMKRYLIPPNVTFLNLGDVRRCLYAIRFGSIGIFDSKSDTPLAIYESTAYFGLRDLLFGEPSHFNHRTLSYCIIYEITHDSFEEVFEDDEELNDFLELACQENKAEVEEMSRNYSRRLRREEKKDRAMEIPSWVFYKSKAIDPKDQQRYKEYHDYFDEFRYGKFFRTYLMNRVVHPAGLFAHWWTCWMSLVACLILCLLIIETFMYYRAPAFRVLQFFLDIFLFMDVYVKLHWAYFLPDGLLVTHPLKTAALYVFEGSFVFDVLLLAHPEMMLFVLGYTSFLGYGVGTTWYTKLRWIRFIQVKRIKPMFNIIHSIFEYRNAVLFVLYVMMTLLVCTIVAAIAFAIGCPWEANDWNDGDEFKLPFCLNDAWAVTKGEDIMENFSDRWIVGVYYVCQVILVVGFGDMITLKTAEVYLLIFMSIFGFIFMRCVIADITAAEVDNDEVRSHYIDNMNRLKKILYREHVSATIIKNVEEHLNHSWKQSKGLQSRALFADLHPSLETDLYEAFVGDRLGKVPLFEGLPPSILRNICKYVKKLYFLTGERVSRYGNLEFHLYIIVSGKVWVTDRFLNYGCTLHKNETFGESGVIGQIPGRFTTIAAENVEIFTISHEDFETILSRYPVLKPILSLRTGNGSHDFFENKIYDMVDWLINTEGDKKDHRVAALMARTQIIKHLVYGREDTAHQEELDKEEAFVYGRKKRNKFISYGTEDDRLPFLYFIHQTSRKTGKLFLFPPLLHPNCGFMKHLLVLVSVIYVLLPAITIYELFFPPLDSKIYNDKFSKFILEFSTILTYCMIGVSIIRIFLSYKDSEGSFVKSSWLVAVNYFRSPSGIWLDLAAAIPSLVCPPTTKIHSSLRYLRLTRSLWLIRYFSHHMESKDDLSVSTFQFKIKMSVIAFVFMAHLLACIFYAISPCSFKTVPDPSKSGTMTTWYRCGRNINWTSEEEETAKTWTMKFIQDAQIFQTEYTPGQIEPEFIDFVKPWRWYVRALYWVVTVVSTTGFGDITPRNVDEMVMGIMAVFCGAFILSIILSQFTAGMASLSKSHREYMYQVKLLVKYLRNIGLSRLKQELVQSYFEIVWNNMKGNLYHTAATNLPPALQIEVSYALFESVLSKVKFFKTTDKNFIRQIASRVEHSVYLPGVCVVKEGDQGNSMFIVYKGRVSGLVDNEVEGGHVLKSIYLVGDTFGRCPALFFDEVYKKSYRADEYTEVLAISQHNILSLTRLYEDFWKILLSFIDKKYDVGGASECIFSNQNEVITDDFDIREYTKKKQEDKEKEAREKHDVRGKLDKRIQKEHKKSVAAGELDSSFSAAARRASQTKEEHRRRKKHKHRKSDHSKKGRHHGRRGTSLDSSTMEGTGLDAKDVEFLKKTMKETNDPETISLDVNPIHQLYEVIIHGKKKESHKKEKRHAKGVDAPLKHGTHSNSRAPKKKYVLTKQQQHQLQQQKRGAQGPSTKKSQLQQQPPEQSSTNKVTQQNKKD